MMLKGPVVTSGSVYEDSHGDTYKVFCMLDTMISPNFENNYWIYRQILEDDYTIDLLTDIQSNNPLLK